MLQDVLDGEWRVVCHTLLHKGQADHINLILSSAQRPGRPHQSHTLFCTKARQTTSISYTLLHKGQANHINHTLLHKGQADHINLIHSSAQRTSRPNQSHSPAQRTSRPHQSHTDPLRTSRPNQSHTHLYNVQGDKINLAHSPAQRTGKTKSHPLPHEEHNLTSSVDHSEVACTWRGLVGCPPL